MTISPDSFVGHIQIWDKLNTLIWAKVTESNQFILYEETKWPVLWALECVFQNYVCSKQCENL